MENLLAEHFGFENVEVKKLNGYSNANYLVKADGSKYIFKTYEFSVEKLAQVEAETEVLNAIQKADTTDFPSPVPFKDDTYVRQLEINGERLICRMLSFLDGDFLGDVLHTKELLSSLGHFMGKIDKQLMPIKNQALEARELVWDLDQLFMNEQYIQYMSDAHDRSVVRYFFHQYDQQVRPLLPSLRKSIIHNDANEWNILVQEDTVIGVIDFGDMIHSSLINEVAIALTYICYSKDDPLNWSSDFLGAYHSEINLEEKEVDILYYLIAGRLCMSVCQSAHSRKLDPMNEYALVSERHAWSMLYKWLEIGPIKATNHFRNAIGLLPHKSDDMKDVLARRMKSFSPILSVSYHEPIYMKSAAFQYMYDAYGNTFLDSYNNIPHIGHCHPAVVEAGQKQMSQLNTNTRYLYDQLTDYAEKLLEKFPPSLSKVFFVNSGSAASDLAIRMAKAHTQKSNILVMEHGYHGNTQTSIDISDYKFNNPKGQGQKDYILKTWLPNAYKGKYTGEGAGERYGKEAVEQIQSARETIAAFIAEPVVGCGGQVPLADGYLKEVYPAVRKQGGVCISDEVQTGFGRLGDHFWGYEAHSVIPDMVVLGKPIANGHPMGAVVCTEQIASSFGQGVEFFSSFGGNPVSCAIAGSVLQVLEDEGLQKRSKSVGDFYMSELKSLQEKFPQIGDVRGSGLFIGVEIVEPGTFNTDQKIAHYLKNELRNRHILISTDGPDDSVLKMKPPLCFNRENAKEVVDHIENLLAKI